MAHPHIRKIYIPSIPYYIPPPEEATSACILYFNFFAQSTPNVCTASTSAFIFFSTTSSSYFSSWCWCSCLYDLVLCCCGIVTAINRGLTLRHLAQGRTGCRIPKLQEILRRRQRPRRTCLWIAWETCFELSWQVFDEFFAACSRGENIVICF